MPTLKRLIRKALDSNTMATGFVESVAIQALTDDGTDPQIIQSIQEDSDYQGLVQVTSGNIQNEIDNFVIQLESIKTSKL